MSTKASATKRSTKAQKQNEQSNVVVVAEAEQNEQSNVVVVAEAEQTQSDDEYADSYAIIINAENHKVIDAHIRRALYMTDCVKFINAVINNTNVFVDTEATEMKKFAHALVIKCKQSKESIKIFAMSDCTFHVNYSFKKYDEQIANVKEYCEKHSVSFDSQFYSVDKCSKKIQDVATQSDSKEQNAHLLMLLVCKFVEYCRKYNK